MTPNRIDRFSGEYRFLSNFYPSPVEVGGEVYPTVEHAYQAMKTDNLDLRAKIRWAVTPGQAKRLGQQVKLRDGWEEEKEAIMQGLLIQKFSDPELRHELLATGNAELVEGNSWGDRYWGVCNGEGQNRLGHLLMSVRKVLMEQYYEGWFRD